jgi:predicted permease
MFLIENSTDVRDYAKLGFLFKLLHADDPQHPTSNEVAEVRKQILGSAASGSALILTGVVVSSQTFRFERKVAWTTAAIVLIQPLFALGMTELFHMSHAEIRTSRLSVRSPVVSSASFSKRASIQHPKPPAQRSLLRIA